jgi:hypothetical protein
VWLGDERALSLSQRRLALCHARWRAGTLFTLSLEEAAFLADQKFAVQTIAEGYVDTAEDAVLFWLPPRTPAEEEARLHGIYGAMRTALALAVRDGLQLRFCTVQALQCMLRGLRDDKAAGGGIISGLQTTCGLSRPEEMALCALARRDGDDREEQTTTAMLAGMRRLAAADVARHGLRRCALPSCAQTEPHPKCYKLCGRCRGAAYCSPAHSKEDWKRHKREQGCTPAGEHAA